MKKILAVAALILIIVSPLMAGDAVGEIYTSSLIGMGVQGALNGAMMGLAGGLPGVVAGLIIGGVVGTMGGGAIGSISQKSQDTKDLAKNNARIGELELANRKINSELIAQDEALALWQGDYDAMREKDTLTASAELESLKENWGITNATLATQNREGITARALSSKQKNNLLANFGDDMSLASDIDARLDAFYGNEDNFLDSGRLSDLGKENLGKIKEGLGLYEQAIFDNAYSSRRDNRVLKESISINEESLQKNNENIEGIKADNEILNNRLNPPKTEEEIDEELEDEDTEEFSKRRRVSAKKR